MPLKSELEENPYAFNVEEDDVRSARQYRERFESDKEFQEALAIWPRCPKCGRRRITRCPVCKTSADLFPLGDDEFFDPNANALDDAKCKPRSSCCKRHAMRPLIDEAETAPILNGEIVPGVPDPRRTVELDLSDAFDDEEETREMRKEWRRANPDDEATQEPPTLLCHVCSEAFRPLFPRRCEWCDYDFGEGEQYPEPSENANPDVEEFLRRKEIEEAEALEPDYKRMTWVCLAIVAALVAFLVYWTTIF